MSSKKAMKQAQKQSYAKHRSNISYNKFSFKKKELPKIKKKKNSIPIVFVFYLYKKEQLKK